jgi:hypothetical protein
MDSKGRFSSEPSRTRDDWLDHEVHAHLIGFLEMDTIPADSFNHIAAAAD